MNIRFDNNKSKIALGAALALVAFVAVAAFQTPAQKMGVVDISHVADKSKLGAREKASFDTVRNNYNALLTFVDGNKVMTSEQMNRLHDLWIAETRTPQQEQELESLKTTIQTASRELRELLGKINHNEQDLARMRELSPLANRTEDVLPVLNDSLIRRMQNRAEEKQMQVMEKAREAVVKVGRDQGFTIIYETSIAPYGANDVTNAALQQMDRDNP